MENKGNEFLKIEPNELVVGAILYTQDEISEYDLLKVKITKVWHGQPENVQSVGDFNYLEGAKKGMYGSSPIHLLKKLKEDSPE